MRINLENDSDNGIAKPHYLFPMKTPIDPFQAGAPVQPSSRPVRTSSRALWLRGSAGVLLIVPFALTGGVLLQWWLGFNFSVAVWVGYIALFGTAIQTGVVMVVYLEDAVKNALAEKRARLGARPPAGAPSDAPLPTLTVQLTRDELLLAIKQGARLRLRPKVMTVATAIAGLLPIFWSTRTGIEVMQPLAAPVVGGMLSSLVHILVVTPVIFAWLRERELASPAKAN
jgi:Cu(I)/Ag(I) efflux system membrane protein CusA/SilA